jgi:Uma2 family endonuclease
MLKTERRTPLKLHSGDHMTRQEFHRIYEQMPEDFKAELIGGIVYVASPMRIPHGSRHLYLGAAFVHYEAHTLGVEAGDNTTVFLADESEPQPDLLLRILPEYGGQSRTTADDYIDGAPELVAEIAHSSRSLDMHRKRADYAEYGVLEYLVLDSQRQKLHWFDLAHNQEVDPPADGILRMRTMPGLWIAPEAVLKRDYRRMIEVLDEGLASDEHQGFVEKLKSQRKRRRKRS